jgi:hypothetical protein
MFYVHFKMVRHYICLILYLAIAWCEISPNIILPHFRMNIKHDMGEIFLKLIPLVYIHTTSEKPVNDQSWIVTV